MFQLQPTRMPDISAVFKFLRVTFYYLYCTDISTRHIYNLNCIKHIQDRCGFSLTSFSFMASKFFSLDLAESPLVWPTLNNADLNIKHLCLTKYSTEIIENIFCRGCRVHTKFTSHALSRIFNRLQKLRLFFNVRYLRTFDFWTEFFFIWNLVGTPISLWSRSDIGIHKKSF